MVCSLQSGSDNDWISNTLSLILSMRLIHASFEDSGIICLMVENFIFGIFPSPVKIAGKYTHITLATLHST